MATDMGEAILLRVCDAKPKAGLLSFGARALLSQILRLCQGERSLF